MPMARTPLALATVALLLGSGAAHAAEVTDLPPWLRGDMVIDYGFQRQAGSLYEGSERVGSRSFEQHSLHYQGVFSAGPGVALFFELPHHLSARLAFPEANEMVYDPSTGQGTMIETEPIEGLDPITGKGTDGLWLGIKGTPFSEAFEKRGNRATWLLEAAFRTRSSNNFFELDEAGERGAGIGGGGMRLGMAFSTTKNISQPYIAFRYQRNPVLDEITLYDETGASLGGGFELQPADQISIRTGTEIIAHDNPEAHSRFSIDLRLGFGYNTWQSVPSGLYLPSMLSTSLDVPATESEYTWASAGVGFYHQAFQYMKWKLLAEATYIAPHQIEHHYPIETGTDTLDITLGGGIEIMIR
jgi:hypothetical protein